MDPRELAEQAVAVIGELTSQTVEVSEVGQAGEAVRLVLWLHPRKQTSEHTPRPGGEPAE